MSSKLIERNEFLKAKIRRIEGNGPCLKALNEFAQMTACSSFYDYVDIRTEQFYIKYSLCEWKEQLWRRTESGKVREFQSSTMQLASQCLYRFQTLCDESGISSRNPVSFFDSLNKFVNSERYSYDVAFCVFLYAATDQDFLFDCSVLNHMPPQFITRAYIEEIKSKQELKNSRELTGTKLPETKEGFNHLLETLQCQVRDFHLLMGPNRNLFCKRWEEVTLSAVRSVQVELEQYSKTLSPKDRTLNFPITQYFRRDLTVAVFECFIWHISSKRHLGTQDKEDIERTLPYLEGKGRAELEQAISMIIDEILQNHNIFDLPYHIYRVITKRYEKLLSAQRIDVKAVLPKEAALNVSYRSSEATSRKRTRFNLLLFKKLCATLSKILPDEVITHSVCSFKLLEPIPRDRYPDAELLDLQPEDPLIAEYIQKGLHSGDAVLPELSNLLKKMSFGFQISPFDVLRYRSWEATPQSFAEFLYSAKDGVGRGKQMTKKTLIENHISGLEDSEKLTERYFEFVFQHPSGYGSGIPTYHWAADLACLVDHVLSKSPELEQICEASVLQREHIELGIHQYFIEQLSVKAVQQATVLGKKLLYDPSITKILIESECG